MSRQTVLLIFGGESSEHDVSIMSARNVYGAVNKDKYDVRICYIDRSGGWWLLNDWTDQLDSHNGKKLSVEFGTDNFLADNESFGVDILFPVLHGENGHEDGAIQGTAQLLHTKVVGGGLGSSAVCWDKYYTKQLLSQAGIGVVDYVVYQAGFTVPSYETLASKLSNTLFVKPTVAGSSIGVSKVRNAAELDIAISEALKHSDTILIERAIVGRELEVAVLGNPPHAQASGVGEIIPGEDFYSYEDKYSSNSKAQVIVNAEIDETLREQLRDVALDAYATLRCKGLARVDFLVQADGTIYVNELNTLPGFTNISQYPKLWEAQGISYPELVDRLIQLAVEN